MSYSIAITVVNGQPVITSYAGDLPAGITLSLSGHEPLADYARRSIGVSVYGPDSKLLVSGGASVDLPPAAIPAAPAPAPEAPAEQASLAAPEPGAGNVLADAPYPQQAPAGGSV